MAVQGHRRSLILAPIEARMRLPIGLFLVVYCFKLLFIVEIVTFPGDKTQCEQNTGVERERSGKRSGAGQKSDERSGAVNGSREKKRAEREVAER